MTDSKKTTSRQSGLLYLASTLVLIMGIILFFLSNDTETYFAWTVGVPLTAAFLGAGYLSSFVLEFMSAREHQWKNSRIAIPAVFLFTSLTFIITLVHIDKFHIGSEFLLTSIITWAWILVYALVPILIVIVYIQQIKSPGSIDKGEGLPNWFRVTLLIQGAAMLILGIGFLFAPMTFIPFWAWAQTTLTARAIGAWLIGLGTAAFHSAMENEWIRIRPALLSYSIFGFLQLINLARYPDAKDLDWSVPKTWIYVFFLVSVLFVGVYGVFQIQKQKKKS